MSREYFLKIASPSFLSGFVSLILSVAVVVVVLTPFLYRGSYLEQYGETLRRYPGGWADTYSRIEAQLNSSEIVANISIFCVWAIAGFAMYYLVLTVLSLFINAVTFTDILGYKNTDKKSFVLRAFERLAVRALGLVCLTLLAVFVFYVLIPSVLTLIAASFSSPAYMGLFYILTSIVFLSVATHMVAVLLRIIFLKPRLISWMYQPSDAE